MILTHMLKDRIEVVKLMYKEIIKLLKLQGVEFEAGLTYDEITKIEKIYGIQFPKSLKAFLMEGLPVSNGFYNWRNVEQDNINFIKKIITSPIETVDELAEEVYWCDDWGEEPENEMDIAEKVREKLKNAPKLLPIYAHRYMPMLLDEQLPVVSIHNMDIIYYGENLEDYFQVEFGKKNQNEISIENIKPIPFWSEIM